MSGAAEGIERAGSGNWAAGSGAGRGHLVRLRPGGTTDAEGLRLVEMVAQARGVPALLLLHRSRCSAEVATARQLAMYLMHVILRRTYAEVGDFFGRDRTTVAHACAQVEDQRDRPRFEAEVAALEQAVDPTIKRARGGRSHAQG